jgi:Bacterial Ig-like domain (group 3)/FG-GAP-like repeat/FG-GAP repeat
MTRTWEPRAQSHGGVALFIATVTILIALVALAPVTGVGQAPGHASHPPNRLQAQGSVTGSSQASSPLFLPAVTYSSGGFSPRSVAVADMNGDGTPDLVVANTDSNTVGILGGNGNGTFQTAVTYDVGGQIPVSVAVADLLIIRQHPQVAVANGCADRTTCSGSGESGVGVLFGFFYPPPATYRSGGTFIQSVKIADVNNDGILDLLVAHLCASTSFAKCTISTPGSVGVLLGNDGIFTLLKTYNSGGFQTASLAVADVNGDGQPDLLVANSCASSTSCINGSVGVLLGNGDATFKKAVTYPAGFFPISVDVADLNGDGKPDLVVANNQNGGSVGVLLGNGDGTFASIVNYASGGSSPTSVAVADVNGDGKLDLVVANPSSNTVGILLGNGDGTFQAPLIYRTGGNFPFSVAIADVNGDGKPDLVVANEDSNNVGVLLNNTGVHEPTSTSLTSSPNPSTYGQQVAWTATVTSSGSVKPTGSVRLTWSGHTIGSATLNSSGVATLTKSNLNADAYPLTAVYGGDADNLASTSAITNQVVLETTSVTTVTSSANPSTQGQAVTFSARVTSPTVTPTGPVTFTTGKTVLGTAQLSGGKASFTTSSLATGSDVVTVTYFGDSNIAKSAAAVTQVVRP